MTTPHHHTARFPKADWAADFAVRIVEPGWELITNVQHSGRTVTFDRHDSPTEPYPSDAFLAMLETVGYFGSPPQGPQATLDGIKAPRSY
jgi:hypothetical protein